MDIQFVAPTRSQKTKKSSSLHITLLMGANGTGKSRILSSCIDFLIQQRKQHMGTAVSETLSRHRETDLAFPCITANLTRDGTTVTFDEGKANLSREDLPSRILGIANLVRDRFPFMQVGMTGFYRYLGVRQATNSTTTGAMDRLVYDALMECCTDSKKFRAALQWIEQLFPKCDLGLFIESSGFSTLMEALRKPQSERWQSNLATSKLFKQDRQAIDDYAKELRKALHIVEKRGDFSANKTLLRSGVVINLQELSIAERKTIAIFKKAMPSLRRIRLLDRPSLLIRRSDKWIPFGSFSSGEQNLLATGARLIGYATPGSFIVIDEPEVSLNVVWQQRYIDLISNALRDAPGSHVLIASHSPYLVADLRADHATIVVVENKQGELIFKSHPGEFWGWGSEAILYDVLGIPAASNYHFSMELASILKRVNKGSLDPRPFEKFLEKCDTLDFGSEPLQLVIDEIRAYHKTLTIATS